jgi:hypothetical protein
MKTLISIFSIVLLNYTPVFAQELTWPHELTSGGSVLTLYQPQVEDWQMYQTLDFRMAFSLVPFQEKEVVGVLYVHASTAVNMDDHMVTIYGMNITQTHFPSLDSAKADSMGQLVRTFLPPGKTVSITVDQLVASTEKKSAAPTVAVDNDPPLIFVSYSPAIMIQVEGKPLLVSADNQNVEFVFNTNWPLFFSKTNSTYYLYDDQEWQESAQVSGPWKFTSSVPKEVQKLSDNPAWADLKTAVPPVQTPSATLPKVFYCEKPGEIIIFDGQPILESIAGTSLKFAVNTDSDVFFCTQDNFYYYLTAGRWFSSQGLSGPWAFATPVLPADFANIPLSSPAARVLASVPGTEEAQDAIMIAQIPTTVEVNAADAAAKVQVTYSGDPKFEPIQGTTLQYAVNTADKVIEVSATQYYLCYQGIWFSSSTPSGPWTTSLLVPQVIYTIPPSSPVYNVTFVTQTVITPGTVQASYTAGYMGVFIVGVTAGAILACGTGYYHPPFFYYPPMGYPVCYPHAMTYGAYAYHPYPYYGGVAHASYNPYTGNYARSATAYGPYGSATAARSYNPSTGTMARGASVSSPYGTRSAAQAYNPYTGASGVTHQGSSPYAQWGSSSVSNGHGESATAGHVTTSQGTTGAIKTSGGDMYADHNGNVYKNDNGSWSKYDNGGWNQVNSQKPQGGGGNSFDHSQGMQSMNNDMQDRQRGGFQSQQFSGGGRSSFGGFGGGGGGGFRGR